MVSRFVAEARAVNQIQSKNIVDIFGFGALPDGRQYFVMELLTGLTLEDFVRQRGRVPVEEAMPIFRAIARALDAAHAADIVHRDLKPENVFLVADDEERLMPKLLDFGIAKLMGGATGGHKTRTGVPMGTPYYMSPEQCRGDKIDLRTDVYSFGVLAFQVLTGALPFAGESFMQIMFAHVSSAPPVPSSVLPGLGTTLDAPILQMLAKAPGESGVLRRRGGGPRAAVRDAGHQVGTLPAGTSPAVASARTPVGSPRAHADDGGGCGSKPGRPRSPPRRRAPRRLRSAGAPPVALVAVVAVLAVAGGGIAIAMSRTSDSPSAAPAPASAPAPITSEAPAPSASAAPPKVPRRVRFTLTARPERVEVFLGDKKLGTVPDDEIRFDRSDQELELTVKADGYRPETITVKPVADVSASVKLRKKGVAGGKPKLGTGALEY